MQTVQLDNGVFNNYASETKFYLADYPAVYEQRRYLAQGAIAALFVAVTLIISFAVS